MRPARMATALAVAATLAAPAALAGTVEFTGTRSNVAPGGTPGARCAPALTINFAPDAFAASGTSNLGDFTYVASHCIAGPPPGNYYDGQFEWTLPGGTLLGTYSGSLAATGTQGLFDVFESIDFTGGTGQFLGATGFANAVGSLRFGLFQGGPASFGDVRFSGEITAAGVPEPATWALLMAGFGVAAVARRRSTSSA